MADFGKPDIFGASEAEEEKIAQSFPNLQTSFDSVEFLLNFTPPTDSVLRNSTKGQQYNRQHHHSQSAGTSSGAVDRAAKKKEIDRAYRERLKQGKMQMKTKLETLNDENQDLKNENEKLKHENVSMNDVLKSQEREIDQLKTSLYKMKLEYEKQFSLVQKFSQLLAFPDLQLENQRLVFENSQLRQTANMNEKISQLIEENGMLELENRVLKVQTNAMCGKLINDDERYGL